MVKSSTNAERRGKGCLERYRDQPATCHATHDVSTSELTNNKKASVVVDEVVLTSSLGQDRVDDDVCGAWANQGADKCEIKSFAIASVHGND